MKRNSDALTRVMCEYWPSGRASVSGFPILISAMTCPRSFDARRIEQIANARRQIGLGDRLLDDLDAQVQPSLVDDGVARIARHEQDAEARPAPQQHFCQ